MKKTLLAVLLVLSASIFVFTQEKKIKLAISPFDDTVTSSAEKEGAGKGAAAVLEGAFSGIDRFYLRPSNAISDYIKNVEMVQLGLGNPNSIIGQSDSLQVDYLTVGTVARFGGRYEVDARTVDINDWSIVHSYGCSSDSVGGAVNDIKWYISEQFTKEYLDDRKKDNEDKSTVSVFKFRDVNSLAVNAGYSGAFSEILNSQLGSYTGITTIERKYAKALINEKVLEMVGVVENDNSDKSLSVKGISYKMSGDFRVFKDVICINYKLQNTADGRIVYMGTSEITSPGAMRPAARVIANTVEDVLNNRVGTVKVSSYPSGAQVMIDDEIVGKTPLVASFQKGQRKMKVLIDNYETHESVIEIAPKVVSEFNVKLEIVSMKLLQDAMVLEGKQDLNGALNAYNEFIKKYDSSSAVYFAYYRKGHLLIKMNRSDDAFTTFNGLLAKYPDADTRSEGYMGLMYVYSQKKDRKRWDETRQYILDQFPGTSAAMNIDYITF